MSLQASEQSPDTSGESGTEFAFSELDWNLLTSGEWWQEQLFDFGPKILAAIAIFVIGRIVARILIGLVRRALIARETDETLTKFLTSVLSMALTALIVIVALDQIGVDGTSFVAIMSAATLAIGFALQDSLGSFAAGVMLILFRPFEVGDYIQGGGTEGIVEEINIFRTMLRTPDNKQIIVPNNKLSTDLITNFSAKPTRRVDMTFGCGYEDDLKAVKAELMAILAADDRILADPKPDVFVLELGTDSVNFAVRPWVKAEDYWGVWGDFHETVKLRFDERGFSIPYPQRDLHVVNSEGRELSGHSA